MRFGSKLKSLTALSAVATLSCALTAQPAAAQMDAAWPGPGPGQQGMAGPNQGGPIQALFTTSASRMLGARQSNYVDANGNPVVVPAGHVGPPCAGGGYAGCEPCGDGYGGYGGGGGYGGHGPHGGHGGMHYVGDGLRGMVRSGAINGPNAMGAGGTAPPIGYDLANDVGMAGFLVDQRGPHYFDARGEVVYMTPDDTFGQDIAITSLNVTDDNIVLSTGQLDYDYEAGFRVIGRFDIGPLSVLEFSYMGIYDWESSASFTDPDPVDPDTGNLFSLFSEFGTNPATVTNEGGPMPETERSIFQGISIDSDLQSVEMTYRRYWVGFIPRISGTILAGFRYTKLKEDFYFNSIGEAAQIYSVRADNDLAGFQAGGDMWIGLMQGVRIGAEGKVGLYNNHYTLDNTIVTSPLGTTPPTLSERFADNEAAFISEGSADIVFDILPSWSLRAGYEILYLNSIVLAGDNFNTASPYGLPNQIPRVPFVAEQGHQVYHGGHIGLEYIW